MTTVNPNVDLQALRRAAELPPPRRGVLRYVVAGLLLVGFAAVLVWSLGDSLRTQIEVTVVRPTPGGTTAVAAGRPAFQAAGWVEPDPFPITVTPLAPGIVAEVLVQESDRVEADQPVAKLVASDAELALAAARQELAMADAKLAEAQAADEIARDEFAQALAVTEADAVAKAELAARCAELEQRRAAVRGGEANLEVAQEELTLQQYLREQGSSGPRQVELAQARLAAAEAELADLHAAVATAEGALGAARARAARAAKDLELRFADRLRLAVAREQNAAALAARERAAVAVAEAELRLNRMTVRAPAAGLVLQRLAMPGSAVGAPEPVCTLWNPAHVRVRVDVPQADVAKAFAGQHARILAETRPNQPYHGEVIRIVQMADIQKVTLQVHVRVTDADEWLRPDMLCQVQFLAGDAATTPAAGGGLRIPARVVRDSAVWVVDPDGRAARRELTLGARGGDEVQVASGLNLTDKVIDRIVTPGASLAAGSAVRIVEQ